MSLYRNRGSAVSNKPSLYQHSSLWLAPTHCCARPVQGAPGAYQEHVGQARPWTGPGQSLELPRRAIGPGHPWSCVAATVEVGRPQCSQHEGSREDVERYGVRVESASREAQFPFYSVALDVLPASFVLRSLLACGRHMFPPLSEATADSSDCLWAGRGCRPSESQ